MGRSEPEFWNARYVKVLKMIDMYTDEKRQEKAILNGEEYEAKYFYNEPQIIYSMKEIPGWEVKK